MSKLPHKMGSYLGDVSRVNALISNSLVEQAGFDDRLISNSLVEQAGFDDRLISNSLVEQAGLADRLMSSSLVEQAGFDDRLISNSLVEQAGFDDRLISNSLVEQAGLADRLMSSSLVEQMNGINRMMSVGSVLTDLWSHIEIAPVYIPARHLGSGPFLEDTEEDTDSLMVIRKSDLHPDVIMACGTELSRGDYFHAVQEAIKGILDRIRGITGLTSDGTSLVEQAFRDSKTPYLALNQLATSSEQNVQRGFKHSLISLISMYRNPMSHELRIKWKLDDTEALVVLLQISQCHKRIDSRHYP